MLYIEKEDCGGGPVITKAKVVELRRRMGFNDDFDASMAMRWIWSISVRTLR